MTRNVTLRLESSILTRCRHAAVEADMSLSAWITDQLSRIVMRERSVETARRRAVKRLRTGFHLGGKPLRREAIYER